MSTLMRAVAVVAALLALFLLGFASYRLLKPPLSPGPVSVAGVRPQATATAAPVATAQENVPQPPSSGLETVAAQLILDALRGVRAGVQAQSVRQTLAVAAPTAPPAPIITATPAAAAAPAPVRAVTIASPTATRQAPNHIGVPGATGGAPNHIGVPGAPLPPLTGSSPATPALQPPR